MKEKQKFIENQVIKDFGREWKNFDQKFMKKNEQHQKFNSYFSIFPWERITKKSIGYDAGCGSGRWAEIIAPKVSHLYCFEPSEAIDTCKNRLKKFPNCSVRREKISEMSIPDKSMDFGYSLGVLHHIPDTQNAIQDCAKKLKSGSPFLAYIYYSLDNRPYWYKFLWQISELMRKIISKFPFFIKYIVSNIIAIGIYFPLARIAKIVSNFGISVNNFPLNAYKNMSFFTMRTDALDRFATIYEKRFSKKEILKMMQSANFENIKFSNNDPYWCVIGYKK